MRSVFTWSSLGVGLAALACSGSDPAPAGSGGISGSPGGGSAGSSAGMQNTAGSSAGSAGAPAGGGNGAGTGGQAEAGGAAGGAAGGTGGASGSGGSGGGGGSAGSAGEGPFALTSPAFKHGGDQCSQQNKNGCMADSYFPKANVMMTINGGNMSPELNWTAGPAGTMSYVMCLHDLSPNTHWCLWNIPAATRQLAANLARNKMPATPAGSSQDSFSGDDDGYMGPGVAGNVYELRLYALNTATYTPPNAENRSTVVQDLEADDDNIVLEKVVLRGRSNPAGYN